MVGYRGKVAERARARELRASGWTMPDIASELGVARSSVSLWVRDVEVVRGPRRVRLGPRPNRLRDARLAEVASLDAVGVERLGDLGEQAFLGAGAALYAREGAKADGRVKLTNTDPTIVDFFCRWLRHFFEIDESRVRATLYLHAGLDLDGAVAYWSELLGIPPSQFTKPYRAAADPTRRLTKHEHGCISVGYSCSATHRAVMGLVRALLSSTEAIPG